MKKVMGFILLITVLFSISFIHASEEDDVEKAYQCLQNRITAKGCSAMTVEEKAFSLLALQDFGTCKNELKSNQGTTIKQKSLSLLALKAVGENTTSIENYLLSQKIIPSGISWYLQVETKGAASCEAFYDNSMKTFSIAANKKLSGNAGGCLSAGPNIKNGYWFLIAPSCHGKTFEISCDSDGRFLTNLLYQEDGSTTIFVSEDTHTAPSGGVTLEKIDSYCFRQGSTSGSTSTCDYEGSLWATLALDYVGKDVSSFIPYLMTKAESNVQLLPESFLYYLTEFPEYQSIIFDERQGKFSNNRYWSVSGDKAYDTALALLPFRGQSLQQKTDAKESLLKLRDNNGCWSENAAGTIKNTAFVLYSIWPELVPQAPECTNNATCVDSLGAGAYCNSNGECVEGNQQQCTNNATCVTSLNNPDAYCSNGVCYEPEDTGCESTAQCVSEHGAGWVCSSGHECILEEDECTPATEDVDCGPEQRCTNGACEDRPDVVVPICGDGIIQQPNSNGFNELCDTTNLGAATSCSALGFNNQTRPPSCYSNCTLNITGCFNSPTDECSPPTRNCTGNATCQSGHCVPPPSTNLSVCGNGIAQTGEACDGNDWRDVDSCTDFLDYDFGNVSCNSANSTAACHFNTTLCFANDECIEDEDCADEGEDYECVYGQCLPPIVDECDDDEFCEEEYGNDYECVFGKCEPKDDGGEDLPDCEDDFGYYCRSNNACLNDDGDVLDQYSCSSSSGICCSKDSSALTCGDQFGDICNSNQQCSGGQEVSTASDISIGEICCVGGTCQDQDEETSDCEWYDGECKTSCGSGESESSDDCEEVYGNGYVCCMESGTTPPVDKGGSLLWLWILLVLIVLVVLGIIFRDKLRIAFMKLKSGGNNPPTRPGFPPPGMMSNRPIPRRILPPSAPSGPPPRPMPPRGPPSRAPPQSKPTQKPKSDLDDVLKKLKEMGK